MNLSFLKQGEKVFIRTVMLYYTGEVVEVGDGYVKLTKAAWIADTGRLHSFLKSGKVNEFEGFPSGTYINTDTIIDLSYWPHKLLEGQN